MLNPIMAGPGVATRATARTIYEDGAEDTASYAVFWRHLLLAMVIDECDDL
jgi:hypothetical protein